MHIKLNESPMASPRTRVDPIYDRVTFMASLYYHQYSIIILRYLARILHTNPVSTSGRLTMNYFINRPTSYNYR